MRFSLTSFYGHQQSVNKVRDINFQAVGTVLLALMLIPHASLLGDVRYPGDVTTPPNPFPALPLDDGSDLIGQDVFVGNTDFGGIFIDSTTALDAPSPFITPTIVSETARLGVGIDGVGRVEITDGRWNFEGTADDTLVIGDAGYGLMDLITSGIADVTTNGSGGTIIGNTASGQGQVTITTIASTLRTDRLVVGNEGVGSIDVSFTGTLVSGKGSSDSTILGSQLGSQGTVIFNDTSRWDLRGALIVGDEGVGTVELHNSANLTDTSGQGTLVGSQADSFGTIKMTENSRWSMSSDLTLGDAGVAILEAEGNSTITSIVLFSSTILGNQIGSTGTAKISGTSRWAMGGDLTIGEEGSGNVEANDNATITSANSIIGNLDGSFGTMKLTGTSRWNMAGTLTVGEQGNATLEAYDNSTITSTDVIIGNLSNSNGTAKIGGTSHWTVDGDFTVGSDGTGVVEVTNGSTLLTNGDAFVGATTTGSTASGTVNLSGLGTLWSAQQAVTVGNSTGIISVGTIEVADQAIFQIENNGGTNILTIDTFGRIDMEGGTIRHIPSFSPGLREIINSGVIRGDGIIEGSMIITGTGELRNAAAEASVREKMVILQAVTVDGNSDGVYDTATDGLIESQGGEMEFQDAVTNNGVIVARDAIMRFRGTELLGGPSLTNNGLLVLGQGTTIYGDIVGAGNVIVDLSGSGALPTIFGDVIFIPGPVAATAGESAAATSVASSIKLILDDNSGAFSIFGELDLGSNASLELDYTLGVPSQAGDTLSVLSADNIIGEFANSQLIADGRYWDIELAGNDVFAIATSQLIDPADYDVDSDIDGLDFLAWQGGFGSTYDDIDFDNWKAWLGEGISPPEAAAAFASAGVGAVPEPTTLALLMLGGVLLAGRRSRLAS